MTAKRERKKLPPATKPKKPLAKCRNCQYLYTYYGSKGNCWYTGKVSNLDKRGCSAFKAGVPFIPKVRGRLAKVLKTDMATENAWIIYTSEHRALLLLWKKDFTGRRFWDIRLVGLKTSGGLLTKNFNPQKPEAAFCGEAEVLGPGLSALYSTFNFDDADHFDEDGHLANKPRVIRIYPAEERKGGYRRGRKI